MQNLTRKIKAYSRTADETDSNKLTRYVYNGSFGATQYDVNRAFNDNDRDVLLGWSKMMDCFFDVIFIDAENEETVTFNKYKYPNI